MSDASWRGKSENVDHRVESLYRERCKRKLSGKISNEKVLLKLFPGKKIIFIWFMFNKWISGFLFLPHFQVRYQCFRKKKIFIIILFLLTQCNVMYLICGLFFCSAKWIYILKTKILELYAINQCRCAVFLLVWIERVMKAAFYFREHLGSREELNLFSSDNHTRECAAFPR